jgi:hypothetical protein
LQAATSMAIDHFNIAGKLSTATFNTVPMLNTFAWAYKEGGAKGVAKLMKTARYSLTGSLTKGYSPEVQAALQKASDAGLVENTGFFDVQKRLAGPLRKYHNLMMTPFGYAEAITRRNAFATGAQIGADKGLKGNDLYLYARDFTMDTMGDYSKANASLVELNNPNIAPLMLKYKKFMRTQFRMYRRLLNDDGAPWYVPSKGRQAAVALLGSQVALSGLAGIMGAREFRKAYEAIFGVDTEEQLAELVKDPTKAKLLMYGIASPVTGIDFSGPLQQSIAPDRAASVMDAVGQAVVGPAYQAITRSTTAMDAFAKGATNRGVEQLLPAYGRNAIRATELARDGEVRDSRGRPIISSKDISPGAVALGFNSPKSRELYEGRRKAAKIQEEANTDPDFFNLKMARALFGNEKGAVKKIVEDLVQHNEEAIRQKKYHLVRDFDEASVERYYAEMMGGDVGIAAAASRAKKSARPMIEKALGGG